MCRDQRLSVRPDQPQQQLRRIGSADDVNPVRARAVPRDADLKHLVERLRADCAEGIAQYLGRAAQMREQPLAEFVLVHGQKSPWCRRGAGAGSGGCWYSFQHSRPSHVAA